MRTVHFRSLFCDDPLPGLQQGLAIAHVHLHAGGRKRRRGRGRQLLQPEVVQTHVSTTEEPAASKAAAAIPASLVANAGLIGPQEPESVDKRGQKSEWKWLTVIYNDMVQKKKKPRI